MDGTTLAFLFVDMIHGTIGPPIESEGFPTNLKNCSNWFDVLSVCSHRSYAWFQGVIWLRLSSINGEP